MKTLTIIFLIFSGLHAYSQQSDTLSTSSDNEYITIPFNISVFPGFSIGESVSQGKKLKNNVSFNLFVGKAAKLEGAEFGGLLNMYSEDIVGAQWAGLMNLVGTSVIGAQWAGLANVNGGDSVVGAQWAGLANINGGNVVGAQWAGLANISSGDVVGAQWAGLANIQKSFSGAQWAGLANISEEFVGIQFAGLVNIAKKVKGGIQIAPVNISETNEGTPIGLLSLVKDVGLHYDVWTDENLFINAGLRSGTKDFHNLVFIGVQSDENLKYTMGFAFGWHLEMTDEFYLEPDFSMQYIKEETDQFFSEVGDNLFKIRLLAGWQIAESFSVYAGPTLNCFVSKYRDGKDLSDSSLFEGTTGEYTYRAWLGFNAGIRF